MTSNNSKLPPLPEGAAYKGNLNIVAKTERGFTISRDYGFTVEEENGKVLAFDMVEHPDLGVSVLFGNQVFALKFWDEGDLAKGLQIISKAVELERKRRKEVATP